MASSLVLRCVHTEWKRTRKRKFSWSMPFITVRKRSLGQGNVFIRVCHSVHIARGSAYRERRMGWGDPLTAEKWAVHIRLECFLVSHIFRFRFCSRLRLVWIGPQNRVAVWTIKPISKTNIIASLSNQSVSGAKSKQLFYAIFSTTKIWIIFLSKLFDNQFYFQSDDISRSERQSP